MASNATGTGDSNTEELAKRDPGEPNTKELNAEGSNTGESNTALKGNDSLTMESNAEESNTDGSDTKEAAAEGGSLFTCELCSTTASTREYSRPQSSFHPKRRNENSVSSTYCVLVSEQQLDVHLQGKQHQKHVRLGLDNSRSVFVSLATQKVQCI